MHEGHAIWQEDERVTLPEISIGRAVSIANAMASGQYQTIDPKRM